jgi:predicted alpha/beta-fold hydrolase
MNQQTLPVLPEAFPRGVFASPFRPAWWLRNAHAQTMFSALFRTPPALDRERERLPLPDDDWLWLDWLLPEHWDAPGKPLVIVVHGLSGSSDSHYVLGLQAQLRECGWGSVALNCRGASGGPNQLARAYHAGSSDDIRSLVDMLALRYPGRGLVVVGYSLGGNMTLKLMGELGDDPRLLGAVAVSVPLLLPLAAERMDRGVSRLYRKRLLDELMRGWNAKHAQFVAAGRAEAAAMVKQHLDHAPFTSFWEFDDKLMAPLHGYSDVHDYYARCSSRQFLRQIRRPTLVIHAEDDPFMSPGVIPTAAELSPWVHFELSPTGGHVGFIEGGSPRQPKYYLERRIPQFIQECNAVLSKPSTSC